MSKISNCMGLSFSAKADTQLPYCSVIGDQGAQYWSWTLSTVEAACTYVEGRVAQAGQTAQTQYEYSGYYSATGNNNASLYCDNQPTAIPVSGVGAQVFANAKQLVLSSGYTGCSIQIN